MSALTGKQGLIVGVANKRSISWAIAQAAAAAGARLALTYPTERLEENVRELAATLDNAIVAPCDVTNDDQIAALASTIEREFGGLDFLVHGAAFAPQAELSEPFVKTTREGFRIALDVSAYSLIGLTRAVAPLMKTRGGGSVLTLTYLGSQRVFTNYNVMGVARLRSKPRCVISPAISGPTISVSTRFRRDRSNARGVGDQGFLRYSRRVRRARAAATQRRNSARSLTRRRSFSAPPRAPSQARL